MHLEFATRFAMLNDAQKQAVETIDGPVLVIAGPGTGKTELLSLRVANILRQTDADPSNIVCLTYTDNAARNMRERLESIIGQAAYHVTIQTFHSFGADIMNRYSDYFTSRQFLQQIGELGRYELLREIFQTLSHDNPLSTRIGEDFVHLKDTLEAISWFKQNALTPRELEELLAANQACMAALEEELTAAFTVSPSPKHLASYEKLLAAVQTQVSDRLYFGFPEYARDCASELRAAIEATIEGRPYAPAITAWRNRWCQKDANGRHVFRDARGLKKVQAVAKVYATLLQRMTEQGLYDFDDMIIEVVRALETNPALRFSLQERYQYVLVDEFQDTNKAQLRMLMALGDNPVYEARPNIMAVGDDDQAIYAFQGAEVSNMVAFSRLYRQPAIITLSKNYRSTKSILDASFKVAAQITDRLEVLLPDSTKRLAAERHYDAEHLEHVVFPSELAQYDWIAKRIESYIAHGTKPEEIVVIAPRHRYLERLMPYLVNHRHIPVAYERRENILESPIIVQLMTMAELVCAISEDRYDDTDKLLSEVLGYDFWQLPTEALLRFSLVCYKQHKPWLEVALDYEHQGMQAIIQWFIVLAKRSRLEPMEYLLDQLMGGLSDGTDNEYDDLLLPVHQTIKGFISPMRDYYFNPARYEQATDSYLTLLGQLSTLRQRLRDWRPADTLYIKDLLEFANLHRAAGLKIIDTNPHTQTTKAVQVMTAYKAKGLEFGVVFVINAQDEVWGPTARSRVSTISLPKNLPLAPVSDGDNDRLRLLFVSLTRAKHNLHVTSYSHDLHNKVSPGLSFISEIQAFTPRHIDKPASPEAVAILTTDWVARFRQVIADKPTLFEPILANYRLSVTHLNNFIDITGSGPQYFFLHNLLRFPEAPTPAAAYGDAIHKTLQWAHESLRVNNALPGSKAITDYFLDMLERKHLKRTDFTRLKGRGQNALEHYFAERGLGLDPKDAVERGFNNEGVVVLDAHLSGKIDKLHYERDNTVKVIDFKTGKPAKTWQGKDDYEKLKLHKYRQQLLFYKLLVEHSASFSGKRTVISGALEFIEPDETGELVNDLTLSFNEAELERFTRLIASVWQHIMSLNFPDVSRYPSNLRGVQQFEQDLIDGII